MTTAHDGSKVVSVTHRPPLPPGNAPGTHLLQADRSDFMTPAGIEPVTFRFVAWDLNHCATAVPLL